MGDDEQFYAAAERRIEYLTLAVGAAGAAAALAFAGSRFALGVSVGAALSWVNYRWMRQGIHALARISIVQAGAAQPRVSKSVYAKFLGRYALMMIGAYAILRSFSLPAVSLVAGLFAVVAAVLVEMIAQLFRRGAVPGADS